jgi:hypothetical protein
MSSTPIERIKKRLKEAIKANKGMLEIEEVKNNQFLVVLHSTIVSCFETSLRFVEQEEGK